MRGILIIAFLATMFVSCKSSKKAATVGQFEATQSLVSSGYFEFQANWAFPMNTNALNQLANTGLLGVENTSGRVNLIGNPNFIRFQRDSISGYLPFFGERQISSFNATNVGITFDGVSTDYSEILDTEKQRYEIQFTAKDATETFQVNMAIFGNKKARVTITSTQRNSIRYEGIIQELPAQID